MHILATPGMDSYRSRADLAKYGDNGLLLFVAQIRLGIDDIDSFAVNALTDGNNDKKCDLVAVQLESQKIIVAQGYESKKTSKTAPANKASDLNTAVSWLLSGELHRLSKPLASAAKEVREAISDGLIKELQVWYVHNLEESQNVQVELNQSADTAKSILRSDFNGENISVTAHEIGKSTIEEEFKKSKAPIFVSDKHELEVPGGFEFSGDGWNAYSTIIPATLLRDLWKKNGTGLLSTNVRDYLGSRRSEDNINHGIKKTAQEEPSNFAIFNNGITVLVNEFEAPPKGASGTLKLHGIGIVNGGQTTGALGSLRPEAMEGLQNAQIMARFVKCTNDEVLAKIVRFNNTQNKVEATDFRSTDAIQERLRNEFAEIPEAEYRGGRRGGSTDRIPRSRILLADSSVAQSLAAFHGDPNLAYNNTRRIWDDDGTYSNVFRDTVSARHIIFCYGLLKAVEEEKRKLKELEEADRTDRTTKHLDFFSERGSNIILASAIGNGMEIILDRKIVDAYALKFLENMSPQSAVEAWLPIVRTLLPFSSNLEPSLKASLKNRDKVRANFESFSQMVEATRQFHSEVFDHFSNQVSSSKPTVLPS